MRFSFGPRVTIGDDPHYRHHRHHHRHRRYGHHRGRTLDPSSTSGKLFLGMFIVIGVGLLIGAGFYYKSTKEFLATAQDAQGEVVELDYRRSGSNGGSYYPVVKFTTPDGRSITFRSNSGSKPAAYDVGEKVTVKFDPEKPNEAKIDGLMGVWMGPIVTAGIGIMFILLPGFMLTAFGQSMSKNTNLRERGVMMDAEVIDPQQMVGKLPEFMQNMVNNQISDASVYQSQAGMTPVMAQWRDPNTGAMHYFRTESWNGTPPQPGETVQVLVDPQNPSNYLMGPDMEQAA